ncbi:hypothetical protein BGZ98_001000 [Dissophora globulifera]|nr:hypothetical protein BGZ98_001000 [Dissophora globulifera]
MRFNLTKPLLSPATRDSKFCFRSGRAGKAFFCDHVPENATVVSHEEYQALLPEQEQFKPPKIYQSNETVHSNWTVRPTVTSKPPADDHMNETVHSSGPLLKRASWEVVTESEFQIYIWPQLSNITYNIAADDNLQDRIAPMAKTIQSALNIWTDGCKTKSADAAILAIAHELGHTIGLAHELPQSEYNTTAVWADEDFDSKSIMRTPTSSVRGLSPLDCRAMDYYNGAFPIQPTVCVKKLITKAIVCDKRTAKILTVGLKETTFSTDQFYVQPKAGGHDEELMDIDSPTCLGNDISKYAVVNPVESSDGSTGRIKGGFAISQCEAIQVESDPGYFYAMQSDGNFVGYEKITGKAVSKTGSNGLGTKGSYQISFQEDGDLDIYDINGNRAWSSGTYLGGDNSFRLEADNWWFQAGSFGIADSESRTLYASGRYLFETFYNVNLQIKGTTYCLDGSQDIGGGPAFLYQCTSGATNQRWSIANDGHIQELMTGMYLDNYVNDARSGDPVWLQPFSTDTSQLWRLLADGTIQSVELPNYCLTNTKASLTNLNTIQMWPCDPSNTMHNNGTSGVLMAQKSKRLNREERPD